MNAPLYQLEDALLNAGIINKEQLDRATEIKKKENVPLEDVLVKLGYSTYMEIIQCLSVHYDLPVVDLEKITISPEMLNLLPVSLIKKYGIIPISKNNGNITIAVSNLPDLGFIDNLRFRLNADIKCALATPENLQDAIRKYFDQEPSQTIDTLMKELSVRETTVHKAEGEKVDKQRETDGIEDEGPVIQLVDLIINKAVSSRASDIHVEPLSNRLRIRYRIDGVCQESDVLPKHLQDSIISRIKILANIDISEKRRPQDGRISLRNIGKELDIRVSCLPSIYGESIVMRLLEKSAILIDLKKAGFYENDDKRFRSIIKKPHGILLITGPTGSGKTTTLYAVINELNKTDTKIITAEDPVEYTLSGVNQGEVNDKIGFNFPMILRTMLRQDPNIILVGEIRDAETADIAIAAALTGHFVLSTLHTNDAPSAITRLIDMGIKPFLVASSLQGIMAQRLVRMICAQCKEPATYTNEQLTEMGFVTEELKDAVFYKGRGCKHCNNIGYNGRLGIYELLEMDEALRDMTYHVAATNEIRKVARTVGMTTLKEDGLRKAKDGKTTLEEVFRITGMAN
ncbi:Type II/IV secretion system protein [Candidatus Brocadiaceae bacterium B188]|nr:Flp pilus assembly complex ATPase component TadA [Candidatus Brocadia sapporoensis]QQR67482.1 MAG: Flp pilus assembly complex ATPase component TadA [Candidatus Brocadia sp.]RZV56781.1 MAG: type II/IV secretion system protein [Candidatus Brocadia sp. BROELEC01]TWU52292.1 Type II/IV secretion system protein [Candidatus Brocadiaceae bacterium B188]